MSGLIGLGDRKSVQPIAALAEGIPYNRLLRFIAAGIWNEAPLQRTLLCEDECLVGGADAILIVEDSALAKKGIPPVGVTPKYATTLAKTANCQTLLSVA
ncbi:transposase [Methylobacterium fujisawaense]|uniref:transposase n=1 Tax=Methylobacterium fujisawaense TaxID=107400 RepID=UPI003AF64BEC